MNHLRSKSEIPRQKKNRKSISLAVKLEVIGRIENGQRTSQVSRDMDLPPSTVRTIYKDADRIRECYENASSLASKVISRRRSKIMELLERELCQWIELMSQRAVDVTMAMIQEKALEFFKNLQEQEPDDSPDKKERFTASRGWFDRFKKRQNIHLSAYGYEKVIIGAVGDLELEDHILSGDYTDSVMQEEMNEPVEAAHEFLDFQMVVEDSNSAAEEVKLKMPPKRSFSLEIDTDKNKKRSRKSVTLQTKLEVLRRIEAGEKIIQICNAMGLAKSTVQTIRDRKEEIKAHSLSAAPLSVSKLTRQRSSIMEKMEKLLDMWIEDNNQRRIPMSQMAIQEKAKSIFEDLKREDTDESVKDVTFQGSRGWFEKFKNRHNLHNLKMKGERGSADDDAAKVYPNILKRIIERGGYRPEQIFNVDETELYWKRIPARTYISEYEKSASGYKVSKERLTLLLGANAAGDFKLKPLLVYPSENPKCFNGLNKKQLPVIWRSNKKGWMTKILFEDWFKNYFCPEVKKYLKDNNLSNKALLILDNSPGYPVNLSELSEDVEIEYLPKNTTSLIQPMDQGAIAIFKAYYLRRIFRKLFHETDGKSSIEQFWEKYSIRDAVDNISESWKELKSTTMNHVWTKIWPECIRTNEPKVDSLSEVRQNILNLANDLGFQDLEEGDLIDFLDNDREPLSNKELIQLETDRALYEEPEPEPDMYRQLSVKNLTEALSYFEQGMNILLQNDPDEERSAEVSRGVNSAITCYKTLLKEADSKTKQTTLDQYFKLGQSTTAESDDSSILELSDSSC